MSYQTMDHQGEHIESSRVEEKLNKMNQQSVDQAKKIDLSQVNILQLLTILSISQAGPGLLKTTPLHRTRHVQAGMVVYSMIALHIYLCSQMVSSMGSRFAGMKNYIISASVVITAYGMLLLINTSYLNIIIVPIAIVFFIVALWNKFRSRSGMEKDHSNEPKHGVSKKVYKLLIITGLPYYALYIEALMRSEEQVQHDGDNLALSHFLWFLSSALGAVAVMISLLPVATVSPGGAQVLQLLHRICIVVLTITAHTKTAEWVKGDMALVCMPELLTVLAWFTLPFQISVLNWSRYFGTLRKIIVPAMFVVLAFIAYPASEYLGTIRALRVFSFSGCLTLLSMYLLRQWPGSTPVSDTPIRMLEFFTQICFAAVALLILMSPLWDQCIYNCLDYCFYRPSVQCGHLSVCLSAWAGGYKRQFS